MSFSIGLPNFIHIEQRTAELWHIDFSVWRPRVANLLPASGLVTTLVSSVKIYLHTTFWQCIRGSVVTNSGFWKQTAAILDVYFRFWFWPIHRHRRVISITLPNFIQIDQSAAEDDVISIFQDGSHRVSNVLPESGFVMVLVYTCGNLIAHQILTKYFNLQLRYYCFRFLKTTGRRIGILLSVSILTYASSSACHFASAYQISSKSTNVRQSYM